MSHESWEKTREEVEEGKQKVEFSRVKRTKEDSEQCLSCTFGKS